MTMETNQNKNTQLSSAQKCHFQKYQSIENSYRDKHVQQCKKTIALGKCDDDFVVEEKAHGNNFSFYFDGSQLKTASRNEVLEDDDNTFCSSHLTKAKYADTIEQLYSILGKPEIRVVGELIGGSYPNSVKPSQKLPKIQKGVDYCPGHEFYAFDLYTMDDESREWVLAADKLETNKLFERVRLFYARPLFRGTLQECLEFENTFKSYIPGWLGLPNHPGENLAEGKVIKPVSYTCSDRDRPIVKDKTESFAEVAYGINNRQAKNNKKKDSLLSENARDVVSLLCAHMTDNRLANVISKQQDQDTNNTSSFGLLCSLICQDALEDFNKDYSEELGTLDAKEQKFVKKTLGQTASQLVAAHFSSACQTP
jgi:Rnl2 family RNA ligase